jgi:hypothetical protein
LVLRKADLLYEELIEKENQILIIKKMNNRILYIDITKGIGIIFAFVNTHIDALVMDLRLADNAGNERNQAYAVSLYYDCL